jgi:hypothetical protein
MNEKRIAERVARRFVAGEDWFLSDDIKKLIPQVVREISRRGGRAVASGGRIRAPKFVLDMLHSIPLEIELYEGSYYPGKVLVDAHFGPARHPVPVQDRQPFDAKAIVDSIANAFISLVNYREASVRTTMNTSKIASQLLFLAKEVLGMDFPTQDAFDKYMKEHPDANRSHHKVVKTNSGKPETHPMNLMQRRKNKQKMKEIGKHYKKDPNDLTNDEIVKFNQMNDAPKQTSIPKSEHTHSFGKMSKGDKDDTKIRVYDGGGDTLDRYAVVVEGKDWESSVSKGSVPMLTLSEGGRGVSQWGEGKEGSHLGKPVKWNSLSPETRKHIEDRLKSSGS